MRMNKIFNLIKTASILDKNKKYKHADKIDRILKKIAQEQNIEDILNTFDGKQIVNDPSQLSENTAYALKGVSNEILNKIKNFGPGSPPTPPFTASDGNKYIIMHGDPSGHFYVGDTDISPDGFVTKEQLPEWLAKKGYGGNIKIIACYAGKILDAFDYSGGSVSVAFPGLKGKAQIAEREFVDPTNPGYIQKELIVTSG